MNMCLRPRDSMAISKSSEFATDRKKAKEDLVYALLYVYS